MTPRTVWSVPGPSTHDFFRAIYAGFDASRHEVRFADSVLDVPGETSDAVLHANWLWNRSFRTADENRAFIGSTLSHLDRLLGQGCRLLWTVHEPFNHDRLDVAAERILHQGMADRATVVHVLSEATVERCTEHFSIARDRVRVLPHPAFLPADPSPTGAARPPRPERRRAIRDALGCGDDVDLVVAVGLRRRYKEHETLARAVRRRRPDRGGRPCLFLSAGRSLTFPVDRITPRLRRLGAATVVSHVPADLFDDLLVAGDVAGLPYSSGLNSGVLAAAVAAATPAVVSDQLRVPEFSFLGDETFFDLDGGHDAIDHALDTALQSSCADHWSEHAEAFARQADPYEISRRFAGMVDLAADGPVPDADDVGSLLDRLDLPAVREQLNACRLIPVERAYAVAMRRLADGARAAGRLHVEFDAWVSWFESTAYEATSDDGIARLLQLGVELESTREAISALHRAADLDDRVPRRVAGCETALPDDERVRIGVDDVAGRIDEAPDPGRRERCDDLERRLCALIEEDHR